MDLGQRLRNRIEAVGLSQAELARRIGIRQPSVNYLITHGPQGSKHLLRIARALETTPEFLMGETDDPAPTAIMDRRTSYRAPPIEGLAPDIVAVVEIDLKYGMGATELEVPVTKTIRQFSLSWLRQYTNARPEDLVLAQGIGDSMAPTLQDSDLLLIDTSDNTLRLSDKIWAFAFGNSGMVKRLRPMPDGSVKILSDNPAVPPEIAHDGEIHIIGRLVASVRKH